MCSILEKRYTSYFKMSTDFTNSIILGISAIFYTLILYIFNIFVYIIFSVIICIALFDFIFLKKLLVFQKIT